MTISSPQRCLLHQLILIVTRITEFKNCSSEVLTVYTFGNFIRLLCYTWYSLVYKHNKWHKSLNADVNFYNISCRMTQKWTVKGKANVTGYLFEFNRLHASHRSHHFFKESNGATVSCSLYVECANLCFHVFYYCKKEKFYI